MLNIPMRLKLENQLSVLTVFCDFPLEIGTIIAAENPIETLKGEIRKYTKNKPSHPRAEGDIKNNQRIY
jgi:transposase-like protein